MQKRELASVQLLIDVIYLQTIVGLSSGVNASSRLEGTKRRRGWAPSRLHRERGLGGAIFCDLEMAYFGDSEVLNLKVFLARDSIYA